MDEKKRMQFKDAGNNATRPLVGGITVTQYHDTTEVLGAGTLGCIAIRKNSTQHVILSCQHVLQAKGTKASPDPEVLHLVRQPGRKSCSFFHYENIVGRLLFGVRDNVLYQGQQYWVDACIAQVNSDVHTSNEVQLIGPIQGSEDLTPYVTGSSQPFPQNYQVKKTGRSTPLTHGIITSLTAQGQHVAVDGTTIDSYNNITISAVAPFFYITEVKEVDSATKATILHDIQAYPMVTITANGNILTFKTKAFAAEGDSGSVLMNSANKVVALISGVEFYSFMEITDDGSSQMANINTGNAQACHIFPVMDQMDIDIIAGPQQTSGAVLDIGTVPVYEGDLPDVETALIQMEAELVSFAHGAYLRSVFHGHAEEIRQLIHHFRPVTVAWHRNGGPAFGISLLNIARDPSKPLMRQYKGRSIESALTNIYNMLYEHGTRALRESLDKYRLYFTDLIKHCNTYPDIMDFLKNPPDVSFKVSSKNYGAQIL